jgi:hypothetical protein
MFVKLKKKQIFYMNKIVHSWHFLLAASQSSSEGAVGGQDDDDEEDEEDEEPKEGQDKKESGEVEGEDTMKNLKKTFAGIFGDIN